MKLIVQKFVERLLADDAPKPFTVRDPHRGMIYFMQRDLSRSDASSSVLRPIGRFQVKGAKPPKRVEPEKIEVEDDEEVTVESLIEEIEQLPDFPALEPLPVDSVDIEDEAIDFIEYQIGRYNFPTNWKRDRHFFADMLKDMPDGDAILAEIDDLAEESATWHDLRQRSIIDVKKPKKR